MGLLDDYSGPGGGLNGIGKTPRPAGEHQSCISAFIAGLAHYRKKYFIFPESVIDLNDLNSKAPDVVVYERTDESPLIFIEVTTTKEKKKIIKKTVELMKEYSIYEAFVYDYEDNTWEKFSGKIDYTRTDSYSDILKFDLKNCLVDL